VLEALRAQRDELDGILAGLDDDRWATPTPRCPGWTVSDVVLHLAQTDEAAVASAQGRFMSFVSAAGGGQGPQDVDEAAAMLVAAERGGSVEQLYSRWRDGAEVQLASLAEGDLSRRVTWVAGEMAARTLATTRLTECWIHTGDIADAVGVNLEPTDRLWHIARLAWRTLPYAFARAGRSLEGSVAVVLTAPDETTWEFRDGDALTTITGRAEDFCLVAGRRVAPSVTSLVGEGPDADAVLELVRTFA